MKAITYHQYGPPEVLQLEEVEKPRPKDNELLIRVRATAANSGDSRLRSMKVPLGFGLFARLAFGISGPRKPILGVVVAGEVEAIGKDVKKFRIGDSVFAIDGAGLGGYAEYKVMPEDGAVALKPANLNFEEAAALPFGGTTALDYLRDKGKLQGGEKVLINGASGAVGIAAVQLARYFGAEVTGVSSTANVEWVKSMGAHKVIDYTKEDFTQNEDKYDIIMDTVGNVPFSRAKNALAENGRLLAVVAGLPDMLMIPVIALTSNKKVIAGVAKESAEDLRFLAKLSEDGYLRPAIGRRYPLEQMAEAHRHVDQGHKRGNVAISV